MFACQQPGQTNIPKHFNVPHECQKGAYCLSHALVALVGFLCDCRHVHLTHTACVAVEIMCVLDRHGPYRLQSVTHAAALAELVDVAGQLNAGFTIEAARWMLQFLALEFTVETEPLNLLNLNPSGRTALVETWFQDLKTRVCAFLVWYPRHYVVVLRSQLSVRSLALVDSQRPDTPAIITFDQLFQLFSKHNCKVFAIAQPQKGHTVWLNAQVLQNQTTGFMQQLMEHLETGMEPAQCCHHEVGLKKKLRRVNDPMTDVILLSCSCLQQPRNRRSWT